MDPVKAIYAYLLFVSFMWGMFAYLVAACGWNMWWMLVPVLMTF